MESNKHVDLRNLEIFVRSKCYPEDILKDTGKKANFRKSSKNFKIIHEHHLTYKGKRRVIFEGWLCKGSFTPHHPPPTPPSCLKFV